MLLPNVDEVAMEDLGFALDGVNWSHRVLIQSLRCHQRHGNQVWEVGQV